MKTNRLLLGILFFMLTVGLKAQQGGYSLGFGGTNDYVTFGYNANLALTASVSIEAWVKLNSTNTQDFVAGKIVHGGTNYGYGLYINNGNLGGDAGQITFIAGISWDYWPSVRSVARLVEGKWYHVVGTFDGQYLKIYVNGVLDNTYNNGSAYSMNDSGDNFKIGYNGNLGENYFDGSIDEVRVWSVARTQQEIRDNMYKEIGTQSNLRAYYRMSDGSGTSLSDNSGNNITGTISSASWAASTAPLPYYTITDGDWTTNSTWASGQNVPTNDWASVKINNAVTLNSGEGKTINDLNVGSGATLTINSGGSLITNGTITNTGTINIMKDISESTWHLVSSPVTSVTANTFLGDYLQSWSEASHVWTDIADPDVTLEPLQGYGLWATPTKAAATFTFVGTPNTGSQTRALSLTEYSSDPSAYEGTNLLGNPYPSAIDWNTVTGYGACYMWNGSAYIAYPATGSYGTGSRYIMPVQGFFIVKGSGGPDNFSLSNANRVHSFSTFYKTSESLPDNTLVLETVSNNYSDKLVVRFVDEATQDFDLQHDAYKLPSGTSGLSELYAYAGEKKLSIDVRPACEVMQLGFSNSLSGEYQISISQINGIADAILEDTKTGTFTDLQNGACTFSYTAGEPDQRFKLHFGTLGISDRLTKSATIYSYRKTTYINLMNGVEGDIYIYNVAGQLVATKLSAKGMNEIGLKNTGNYIVRVVTDKSSQVKKIFIR